MHDESVPLAEVEAGRVAFERRIAILERLHQQVCFVSDCPDVRTRQPIIRGRHTTMRQC